MDSAIVGVVVVVRSSSQSHLFRVLRLRPKNTLFVCVRCESPPYMVVASFIRVYYAHAFVRKMVTYRRKTVNDQQLRSSTYIRLFSCAMSSFARGFSRNA